MPYLEKNSVHVYPVSDIMGHTTDKEFDWDWCDCMPSLETVENGQVVITHNSWDGREENE